MNYLHRFARWVILLYARIAAAIRAWDAEGERLKRDEDGIEETIIRDNASTFPGIAQARCPECGWILGEYYHPATCSWYLRQQELMTNARTPADLPEKE